MTGTGLALGAIWLAALPLVAHILATTGVVVLTAYAWRQARVETRLRLLPDGSIQVLEAGDWLDADIDPASFASLWLIVLRWRYERDVRARVLLQDSAEADGLRRLRVRLRWGRRTLRDTAAPDAG